MAVNYKLVYISEDIANLEFYGQGMQQPKLLGIPANMGVLGENLKIPAAPELQWGEMYTVFLFPVLEQPNEETQTSEAGGSTPTLAAANTDSGRPSASAIRNATVSRDAKSVPGTASGSRATETAESADKRVSDDSTPAVTRRPGEGGSGIKPSAK